MGRQREELLGRSVWKEFPEAVGSIFEKEYRKAIASRQPITFDAYFAPLHMWFEVHAYPSDDGLAVYFQDVTTQKKDEERLHLLESVVVSANDAVLVTEANLIDMPGPRILYVNEALCQMTGYSREEVLGRSPRLLQGAETSRRTLDQVRSALEKRQPVEVELLNYRKDGSSFWVQLSIVPATDEKGNITHLVSIQRDITERKQIEWELQVAKQEAERANAAKSEFLSRMSHDLRTPLNAILGFGQLLELSPLSKGDVQSVEQIMRGGRHLLGLINEVLDIASVESGQLRLHLGLVNVTEMCHYTLLLIRTLADQRQISIHDNSPSCPLHIIADQQRLRQVLLNLLSNAVKYNREGGSITLWCENVSEARMQIYVRDEGRGIPLDKQNRLFMPFDRLDIENDGIEGTGIGLAFSRHLMQAMGGQLGFRSEVGKGSTFWLELPLAPNSAKEDCTSLSH